jgi:hypothetical protein
MERAKAGVRHLWRSHPDPRGHNTPHGEEPRSGVSKDVAAVTPASRRPHLSRNERINWSLNGFIR